jgi:NAD(P)-dependent dehydrogenase (short-subunit alcohol dehydrogenase family)
MHNRRSVVITGASTGIGRACALHLAERGFRVLAGVRREADGAELAERAGPGLTPLLIDVTDAVSIGRATEEIAGELGDTGLTGLVNNAGMAVTGPLEFLPMEDLRRQFEVNVLGAMAMTQAVLPLLRKARGRVINMGSIGGRAAIPFGGAYTASKFALRALNDSLRKELRPWGIEVSLIEPGRIATPAWEKTRGVADRFFASAPPLADELYGAALRRFEDFSWKMAQSSIPAEAVAEVVLHALTAPRPRTRYLVGLDAKIQAVLVVLLPDRALDSLVARLMGLPPKARW